MGRDETIYQGRVQGEKHKVWAPLTEDNVFANNSDNK